MRRLRFFGLILGMGLSASSCADSSAGWYIRNLGVPDVDNSCEVKADVETNIGNWDLASGRAYSAALLLESRVRTRKTDLNADPNAIRVEEIEVHIFAPDGSEIGSGYTTPVNAFLPSSQDGTTPGTASFFAPIIPANYPGLSSLQGSFISVEITARGHTLGTTKTDSGPFTFQIVILKDGSLAYSATDCMKTTDPAVSDPCQPGFNGGYYCPMP